MAAECWSEAVRDRLESRRIHDKPLPFSAYRDDPVGFIRDKLGHELWHRQEAIARDVAAHPLVAVEAGKGPGKTFLVADLALWFLLTREDSIVITTSGSWDQVKGQLWARIRSAHAEASERLPGEPIKMRYELGPAWFAAGFSPRAHVNIAGYHARASEDPEQAAPVFVVSDESSKLDQETYFALRGCMTNPGSRFLMTGNPWRTSGPFYEACHGAAGRQHEGLWRVHRISAEDAPRWIVPQSWLDDMAHECGPEPDQNPTYQVMVLGRPPDQSARAVYPVSLLHTAARIVPRVGGTHMGVDVARHGGDLCVAVLTVNGRVRSVDAWAKAELAETVQRIRRLAAGWSVPPENVHIDVTGIGWFLRDRLFEMGMAVDAVDFGAGPAGDWQHVLGRGPRMRTRRQELHWIALRLLQEGLLSIPDEPRYGRLWSDMTSLEYAPHEGVREEFQVEVKDHFKARTGRSPDYLDALLASLSRSGTATLRLATVGVGFGSRASRRHRRRGIRW